VQRITIWVTVFYYKNTLRVYMLCINQLLDEWFSVEVTFSPCMN